MGLWRTLVVSVAAACCPAVVGPARAQPPSISLRWVAPPRCPTREQLLERIERELGDTAAHPAMHVDGEITQGSTDFQLVLRLEVRDDELVRTVSASSCEGLSDTAALLVAMALDGPAPPGPEPAPAPDDGQRPAPPPEPPGPAWKPSLTVGAAVALESGALPGPALGVIPSVGLGYGPLDLIVDGIYLVPRSTRIPDTAGTATAGLAGGGVQLCYAAPWPGDMRVGVCGRGEVGLYFAGSSDISGPRSDDAMWLAFGPTLHVEVDLGSGWSVRIVPAVLIPTAKQALVVRTAMGPSEVFRSASLSWRLPGGIAYTFR